VIDPAAGPPAAPAGRPLGIRAARCLVATHAAASSVTQPLQDAIAPARAVSDDLADGRYEPLPPGHAAVYRIRAEGRSQVGLLAEVDVSELAHGRVRPHEATRPHAVGALAEHLELLGIDIAPVTLAHPADPALATLLATVTATPPDLAVSSVDGAEHEVWIVADPLLGSMLDRLRAQPALYVVDGHHRCAAEVLLADRGDGPPAGVFALVVSDEQLSVHSFHLVVHEVTDTPGDVVAAVGRSLGVPPRPCDADQVAALPPGTIGLWSGEGWYRFETDTPAPVGDVLIVHEHVLGPVFAIHDPEQDRRLVHVAGTLPPAALVAACPAAAVAFVVHPPAVAELFRVADTGGAVPPKSSYFVPKAPAGLFVRLRT
jgi:uncharacterized protein (DUF1015 family)